MTQRSLERQRWIWLRAAGALIASVGVSSLAAAQSECESDSDCGEGMICMDYGQAPCPARPPCEPGTDCPDIEWECPDVSFRSCVPGPCETDADCGDGLKCTAFEFAECSGSPGALPCDSDDEPCEFEEPEPVECTMGVTYECAPAWSGECEADADCGPGFTCTEAESCWCSAGSASEDGEDGPVTSECGCEPSGHFYCELNEVECDSDGDCESGLTCQELFDGHGTNCAVTEGPRPVTPADDGGDPDDPSVPDQDGEDDEGPFEEDPFICEPEVREPRSLCLPPNYLDHARDFGGVGIAESGSAVGSGPQGATNAPPPRASADTGAQAGDDSDGEAGAVGSGEGAGLLCAASPGVNAAGGLWLALAPALLWLRRREVR